MTSQLVRTIILVASVSSSFRAVNIQLTGGFPFVRIVIAILSAVLYISKKIPCVLYHDCIITLFVSFTDMNSSSSFVSFV